MEMAEPGFSRQKLVDERVSEAADGELGCCGYLLVGLSMILVVLLFPFSLCACLQVIQEYERAVVFRLGRVMTKAKGPGLMFVLPGVDKIRKVDLRVSTYNIPPQEILTKDSVTVMVDAVIYLRIFDSTLSVINIKDAYNSTFLLGATTLRTILGTCLLSELLSDREKIDGVMRSHLDQASHQWGVKVDRVEVKDVKLPIQMQRAMAAEAEAHREARAKVVAAEGEMKASRSLKEASDVLTESSAALQLRYLQTLHSISEENNSTIIFPIPVDLLAQAGSGLRQVAQSSNF